MVVEGFQFSLLIKTASYLSCKMNLKMSPKSLNKTDSKIKKVR